MIRRLLSVLCVATLACATPAWAASSASDPASTPITAKEVAQGFREASIIAKPRATASESELAQRENQHGAHVRRAFKRFGGLRVLDLAAGEKAEDAIQQLRSTGLYEYVEPNYIKHAHATPNDTRFAEQWYLRNTGQSGGKSGADVSATTAWDTRTSTNPVIVAVLDTGVRITHEDLAANIWTNTAEVAGNGVDDDHDGYIDDVHGINALSTTAAADAGNIDDNQGHGTSVAGVLAAAGNNGKGIAGLAWQAKIMPLKFADSSGHGELAAEIACIDYAIAHGAGVINISYGSNQFSQGEFDAIKRARDAGIPVAVSAGNDGVSSELMLSYPASYLLENIVAVANSDRNDTLSENSSYGPLVELAAPGTDILSCANSGDGEYRLANGTSFSSPLVAGALALVKAQYPSDNYRALINRVLRSVDSLSSLSGKVQTGGRLNLAKALTTATNRPFNDDFANRSALSGDTATTRGVSTFATAEASEPSHGGTGGASLWWTWTATRSGSVLLDTGGSSFDTLLAVYTGSSVGALTQIASNDDATGRTTSRVTFTAVAGTSYHFAVDGKGGSTGLVALSLGVLPDNDNWANAIQLSGVSVTKAGSNKLATQEPGEPTGTSYVGPGKGKTVWYRWTAPRTSHFTVSAYTKGFNSIVSVYTGSSVSALASVASQLDAANFSASAGTTYYIAVDTFDGNTGQFTLTLLEALQGFSMYEAITPSIAIGKDDAIVVATDSAYIFYYKDDSHTWTKQLKGVIDVATPSISPQGVVYVSTSAGLYALNPDGSEKWSKMYSAGVESSPSIAADGAVYAHVGDGYLYAFQPDGTQKWRAAVPGVSYSSPSIGSDGTIYIGSDDHNVYALSPTDGAIKWKYDTSGEVYASVAIGSDGTLYVGNLNAQFHAISPIGAKVWSYQTGGNITCSASLAADGTIYFGCYDGKVYALTSAGTIKWTYSTSSTFGASSPAVGVDGTIYLGALDGNLYAITSTGTLKQTYPTAGMIRSSPVIVPDSGADVLFFGSNDERFYVLVTPFGTTASPWSMHRQNPARTGRAIPNTAPTIKTQPLSKTVATGSSVTLAVNAEGQDTLTFQWYFNGSVIAGATQSTYTITNVSAANAGSYTVTISNGLGSVTSTPATVSVATASDIGRIVNLSARAVAGSGNQTLIVGLVIQGGSGTKPLLARGVGPTLANFSVPGFLADPMLTVYSGNSAILSNDNWATDPQVPALMNQVNAFAFTGATSKDAALAADLAPGGYTIQVTSSGAAPNGSGVALAEFYDASPVFTSATPRLVNISARSQVGTGGDVLIVGFVIGGSTPVRVLMRGVGPGLAQFGVGNLLANPKMTLRKLSGELVQENDDWGQAPNLSEVQSAMSTVNAFTLGANSKDSVIVTTLQPGGYTAVISGVNDTTGVALAEVYEVP